jgi:hypothetical protein
MDSMEHFRTCPEGVGVENTAMKEIIFEVLEEATGGYSANALGYGIHTQGDGLEDLRANVREAVGCYFENEEDRPAIIRLHFVRDEVLAL